jgi:hypothetical protein
MGWVEVRKGTFHHQSSLPVDLALESKEGDHNNAALVQALSNVETVQRRPRRPMGPGG